LINIDGLTLKTYSLEYSKNKPIEFEAKIIKPIKFSSSSLNFETEFYKLSLQQNGLIKSFKSKSANKELKLDQEFNAYESSKSGIYVFRPYKDKTTVKYTLAMEEIFEGDLVTVAYSESIKSVSQRITIFKRGDLKVAPLIESTSLSWDFAEVGFSLNVQELKKKTFYNHDSNEFVKRDFHQIDELIESGKNIYPAVQGYAVKDKDYAFGIVNSYPTGCGFISNDQEEVQCFLTRSTNVDDDKGLPDVMSDTQKVTFSYFLMLNKANKYNEDFMVLSDYFNLPLTTKYIDEDLSFQPEIFSVSKWVLSFFTEIEEEIPERTYNALFSEDSVKDYFYSQPTFTLLKDQNLDKRIEVFDLFKSHRDEVFVRVRNRQQPEFLGEKLESYEADIDIKDTFIFDIDPKKKYTLDGLKLKQKKKEENIIKNAFKMLNNGYHYVKDDVFKMECNENGKAKLKPGEIGTFKLTNKD